MAEPAPTILSLPSASAAMRLAGSREENLPLLAELTGVQVVLRGVDLWLTGSPEQIAACEALVKALEPFWAEDRPIAPIDIREAKLALDEQRLDRWQEREVLIRTRRGDVLQPRTVRQQQYVQAIETCDLTFGIGPAGTGKTFLAAAVAVKALLAGQYERLILTRPAVEAGERLGFLPGDLQQKIAPYLRPLYDALYDLMEPERVAQLTERNVIEIAPLAYMRGRTLNNAFIIVDEAQNTTTAQMKMVLTRLGFNSRMVVTGDITQIDLPSQQQSGLIAAERILQGVEGVAFAKFTKADVVRHPLVQRIVAAYEREGK